MNGAVGVAYLRPGPQRPPSPPRMTLEEAEDRLADIDGRLEGCECRPFSQRLHDYEGCIAGEWYGFCSSDNCYGMCEPMGPCGCPCHEETPPT